MIVETLKCNYEYDGSKLEYTYKLIQRELKLKCSNVEQQIDAYGVEIESMIVKEDKSVQRFKEEVKYITPYKYKGSKLLHMLEKSMVSPIHLIEVSEEIIEDYIKDFDEVLNEDLALVTI